MPPSEAAHRDGRPPDARLAIVSPRRESVAVLRVAAVIFFAAWFWIGSHGGRQRRAETGDLLPFQSLFRDLDPALQRAYRSLEEGAVEAERVRSAARTWPDVAALAAEGIPPFAPDPIDKTRYAWRFVREGTVVNYRGIPASAGAPDLLLLVQEPEPGSIDTAAEPGVADETHHRLSDGTLLHVTVWFRRAGGSDVREIVDRPFAEGWTQILAGNAPGRESS